MSNQHSSNSLPLNLGNGLILRRSTPADADRLAEFNARIHPDPSDPPEVGEGIGIWTRDLLRGNHPSFNPDDFTIVEDTHSGKIISSLNLISQTWTYEGIPFGVGRPELVATDPEYRNRGLVRKQFDIVHQWSKQRGQMVQVITGIPYFYRQFGYEMAINLGGGRTIYEGQITRLKADEAEPYSIRLANETDIPDICAAYAQISTRNPIVCLREPADWQYEISGKSSDNFNHAQVYIIADQEGQTVGAFASPPVLWNGRQVALFYELNPGISYQAVTPSVLRYLWSLGEAHSPNQEKIHKIGLNLGSDHPSYSVLQNIHAPASKPYAFYVRVPDLVGFIRHIAPALEKRLKQSPLAGHTGLLKIGFYRGGMKLEFKQGKLVSVENYEPEIWSSTDACFPGLTFLQLVFCYRSLEEICYAFPDSWANSSATPVLNALFPKKDSDIWPIS